MRKQVNTFLEAFSDATIAVKTFLITLVFFYKWDGKTESETYVFHKSFSWQRKVKL